MPTPPWCTTTEARGKSREHGAAAAKSSAGVLRSGAKRSGALFPVRITARQAPAPPLAFRAAAAPTNASSSFSALSTCGGGRRQRLGEAGRG